ncbi:serine hydrolase domain-containing protein [Rheinheimera sp. WS51]|uniref:serine hydrolase domain-containing protein n=1 Tax=Rheinheimera sp. WS51 TaxID=3425886 RepID=UPI003D8ACAAC
MALKPSVNMLRLLAVLVVVGSISAFAPVKLVFAWLKPLPEDIPGQLTQTLEYGFDGIIAYVDIKNHAAITYTAGWHNRDLRQPARPDALFKIASIGKLYDAVAITKLISANTLSADSRLSELLPQLADTLPNADIITLRMLVQHRSGLANFTDTAEYWQKGYLLTDQQRLALIYGLPANFAPDSQYQYSNTNYLLLQRIIEQACQCDQFDFINNTILQPLGLDATFRSIKDIDTARLMSGYYVGIKEDIKHADYGAMVATAADVGVFLRALNDGSLLSEDEKQIYSSLYQYQHSGLIPGYQSLAHYDRDSDTVIVLFANTTDFSDDSHWAIFELMLGRIKKIAHSG